jgi:hypothetical protein|tara:strand:+ start:59 stop:1516 length:1458 start_codon:yes stop_codon:yes gene_type:complete
MRLVGGNISDTPVKEIGDGSAFAVGGSSDSAPALIEFGTIPATGTALSNFESYSGLLGDGSGGNGGKTTVKWSDNSYGCWWMNKDSPYEFYYVHIQTNADGTFASEGTKVDLTSDMSAARHNTHADLSSVKLSASRVVIHMHMMGSGNVAGCEDLVYDKNGDGLTKHGSVYDHGAPAWGQPGLKANYVGAVNSTQGLVFWQESPYGHPRMGDLGHYRITGNPVHFTDPKTVGTQTIQGTNYNWSGQSGVAFSDNSDPCKVFTVVGGNPFSGSAGAALYEWSYTTGSTPQIPSPYITSHTGWQYILGAQYGSVETQSDGPHDNGGGLAVSLINRNDIERGRFLASIYNNPAGDVGLWAGVTTNLSMVFPISTMSVHGTDYGNIIIGNQKIIEISYDTDTYWGKYIHISYNNAGFIAFSPFNYNWNTFAFVTAAKADLPNKAADVTLLQMQGVRDVMLGNASADNLLVIFDEDGSNNIRYLNVPFTA